MAKIFFCIASIFLLPLFLTNTLSAQIPELVKSGFENVSVCEDSIYQIFTVENNARYLPGIAARKALDIISNADTSKKQKSIVFLRNGVPYISVTNSKTGPWKIGYKLPEGYNKNCTQAQRHNSSYFKTDIVIYPELLYRNYRTDRLYEVVFNLSPAIELTLAKGLSFVGQIVIPIYNGYGKRYARIRPGFITLTQQIRLPRQFFISVSGGTFEYDRCGIDAQLFHPFKNIRWGLHAQMGLTGYFALRTKWEASTPGRVTGRLGISYYEPHFNLYAILYAGKYLYEDYGVTAELNRHFRYATIGFYVQKTSKGNYLVNSSRLKLNGGFKIAIALPPYRQIRKKKFRITPASHFRLTYNTYNDGNSCVYYRVHPGESNASANFQPYFIQSEINRQRR